MALRTGMGAQPALFTGRRSRYLVVYPFTKSTDWFRRATACDTPGLATVRREIDQIAALLGAT